MQTWQDLVDVLIEAGQYDSPHTIARGYLYRVLRVDVVNDEFFAALRHHSSEEIRVLKIPQRSRKHIRILLLIMQLSTEDLFFMENVGNIPDGEVILRASGILYRIIPSDSQ
jgi:hypothetical protein